MKSNIDKAIDHFSSGFNCAQSVIASFCEKYSMEEKLALKITSGLGGGFRSGEVCGAVTGAVLIIGLKYGQFKAEDIQKKKNCYVKTEEFIREFKNMSGTILCRDILAVIFLQRLAERRRKKKTC